MVFKEITIWSNLMSLFTGLKIYFPDFVWLWLGFFGYFNIAQVCTNFVMVWLA